MLQIRSGKSVVKCVRIYVYECERCYIFFFFGSGMKLQRDECEYNNWEFGTAQRVRTHDTDKHFKEVTWLSNFSLHFLLALKWVCRCNEDRLYRKDWTEQIVTSEQAQPRAYNKNNIHTHFTKPKNEQISMGINPINQNLCMANVCR